MPWWRKINQTFTFTCSECGATREAFHSNIQKAGASLRRHGWRVNQNTNRYVCPDCIEQKQLERNPPPLTSVELIIEANGTIVFQDCVEINSYVLMTTYVQGQSQSQHRIYIGERGGMDMYPKKLFK